MNFLFKMFSVAKKYSYKQSNNNISIIPCKLQHFRYGALFHDEFKGSFNLPIENENEKAYILYKRRNGVLELYETVVPDHLRGYGIANDLAKEVFEYVSENDLKIILKCDFLQKFYEENPFYEEIVIHENNDENQ